MASANDVPEVIEPLLEELLHSDLNWFTVEFAPTEKKNKYNLTFCNKGKGGLAELRDNLSAKDRIFYGSLQVDLVDANGSRYDKYLYFKYLPNGANKAKRHLWGWEQQIKTAFKFKHVMFEYLDENLTGFTEEGITKEFLRVSENQMEYNSVDFGGNNVYKLKGGKVKPPSDMGKDNDGGAAAAPDDAKDEKDDAYNDDNNNDNNDDNNNDNNDNDNNNYNNDNGMMASANDSDVAGVPDADADTYDAPPDSPPE